MVIGNDVTGNNNWLMSENARNVNCGSVIAWIGNGCPEKLNAFI